jgi:hypothetical protein
MIGIEVAAGADGNDVVVVVLVVVVAMVVGPASTVVAAATVVVVVLVVEVLAGAGSVARGVDDSWVEQAASAPVIATATNRTSARLMA